jgi:carbamate kinase
MAVTRQSVMPRPLEVLEAPAIAVLLAAGYVVVCAGGGSVPVIRAGDEFRGVEAVVDKDLTAAVLARQLGADTLIIATDVDRAVIDRGQARPLPSTRSELASSAVWQPRVILPTAAWARKWRQHAVLPSLAVAR